MTELSSWRLLEASDKSASTASWNSRFDDATNMHAAMFNAFSDLLHMFPKDMEKMENINELERVREKELENIKL